MLEDTYFYYLKNGDKEDFIKYFGTDDEYTLVCGCSTMNRLERHLSENEFHRLKVLMTALVRTFKLPPVRYTNAIAMVLYHTMARYSTDIPEADKHIVNSELSLMLNHLQTEGDEGDTEMDRFERDSVMVLERWNEYLKNPSGFSLSMP